MRRTPHAFGSCYRSLANALRTVQIVRLKTILANLQKQRPLRLLIFRPYAISLVAAGSALVPVQAQRTAPPAPDTIAAAPQAPAQFRGLPAWSASNYVTGTSRYRVLLASALGGATLDAAPSAASMNIACKIGNRTLQPPPSPVIAPVGSGTSDFAVIVLPASAASADCAQRWDYSPIGIWSGLSFDQPHSGPSLPRALRVLVDDSVITPARATAERAHSVNGDHWATSRSQLRYLYPMAALRPHEDGTPRRITIEVWSDSGATMLSVPDADLRNQALDYAVWRVATASQGTRVIPFSLRHAAAQGLIQSGSNTARESLRDASLRLAPRLHETAVDTMQNIDVAALLLAEAALDAGDTPAATAMVRIATKRSECVEAAAGSSEALRAVVSRVRGLPCSPVNTPLAFVTGLLFPGGGYFSSGSRAKGIVSLGIVSSALLTAAQFNSGANTKYAEYQGSRDYNAVPRLYQESVNQRGQARTWLVASAALWVGDALLAAVESHVRNALIDRQKL